LTHPFPQIQSLVAQNPTPPQGGNLAHPSKDNSSSSAHIYMFNGVDLITRTKAYDRPPGKTSKESVMNGTMIGPPSTFVTPSSEPLQIEKLNFDPILCLPKSTIWNSTFNPNSRATHNYNIVEDMG
jgi:hypothetical protein